MSIDRLLRTGAALCCLLAPASLASASDQPLDDALTRSFIGAYETHTLAVPTDRAETITVPFTYAGETYTMLLTRHSVRAPNFRVLTVGEDGAYTEIDAPPVSTYQGTLLERNTSTVTACLTRHGVKAIIRHAEPGEASWAIQPSSTFAEGRDRAEHVIYTSDDILPMPSICETVEAKDDDPLPIDQGENELAATHAHPMKLTTSRGGIQVCELAWDVDWEGYQELNSSVEDSIAEVERITADVNVVYERDVQITHQITMIVVRTSAATNPYTTDAGSAFLPEVGAEWNMAPLSAIQRDLLHVLTGRNIINDMGNTNLIGIAYVDTTCSQTGGIGISENLNNIFTENGLVAHEMGHNWSANHCNADAECRIMCSGIGGCDGLGAPEFAASAIASITNKRDTVTCLDPLATTCAADFDLDGDVDLGDFGIFGSAFGSFLGDANYDPAADLDNDGDVDLGDFGLFGSEFNRTDC